MDEIEVGASVAVAQGMKWDEAHAAFSRALIEAAWNKCNGRVIKTANLLGISRKYLWELRRKLGLAH